MKFVSIIRDIKFPVYFQTFGEKILKESFDENLFSGFLVSISAVSKIFSNKRPVTGFSLDNTKIFFEPIPSINYLICLGITKEYCTEKYNLSINKFIKVLRREFTYFFKFRCKETDTFNETSDYSYLITQSIVDYYYHKFFPALSCLLDSKEINSKYCLFKSSNNLNEIHQRNRESSERCV